MTNYRITMCEHDKEQWNFCPDCGDRLRLVSLDDSSYEEAWTCQCNSFHILIFVKRCGLDENCNAEIEVL